MNEIALLRGAETDSAEIYSRLADIHLLRAEEFDETLDAGLLQLVQQPRSAPPFLGLFHRLVLPRLPYAVFYTIESRRVVVHAILDTRQDPRVIRLRLGFGG
ncbi:MAG: type II toxin-antitoxin system RelE/ParE family toxin [Chthoniobacteraceae bacterium]